MTVCSSPACGPRAFTADRSARYGRQSRRTCCFSRPPRRRSAPASARVCGADPRPRPGALHGVARRRRLHAECASSRRALWIGHRSASWRKKLGIGPRHLLRLFLRHAGATPSEVAATRRVQLAKRLIDDTAMPLSAIAFAAGFGSVRRFNDAFRATYGRPPSSFRRGVREPKRRDHSDRLRLPRHLPNYGNERERSNRA
jgi:AraC-like DNA-binding protein